MDPLTGTLLNMGLSLLLGAGQQGASGAENKREDKYNANQGQAIHNFVANHIMQPIGPGPGIPTLNDPSAFNEGAVAAPDFSALNPQMMAAIAAGLQGGGQGGAQVGGPSASVSMQPTGGGAQGGAQGGAEAMDPTISTLMSLFGNVAGPSLPGLLLGISQGDPLAAQPGFLKGVLGGGSAGGTDPLMAALMGLFGGGR